MSTACSSPLALPTELREYIYHLAYSPSSQPEPIDLFRAQPPKKSLLLACKQICRETSAIYRIAYRQYWLDNKFTFDHRETAEQSIDTLRSHFLANDIPLSRIKPGNLRVITSDSHTWHLVHRGGAWRAVSLKGRSTYICLRGWITTVTPNKVASIGRMNEDEIREVCERAPSRHSLVDQMLLLPTVDPR